MSSQEQEPVREPRHSAPGLRALRLADAPSVSVVVASGGDLGALRRCLGALLEPCRAGGVEIVVARSCSTEEYSHLERDYPTVLFMPAPDASTVRQLRMIGLSAADGDIVSIIEDGTVVDADWVARRLSRTPR